MHPARARRAVVGASALLAALVAAPTTIAAGGFVEDVDVLYAIHGGPGNVYFGWAVSELPDIDGDGVMDIVTGDPLRAGGGVASVYSGADGSPIHAWTTSGTNNYGYAIAAAGDTDGDGISDILVGDPLGRGSVDLRSGATGERLHLFPGFAAGDGMGAAVASAGDVDGDGRSDLLLGAPRVDGAIGADAGAVYVVSGATFATLRTIRGEDAAGRLGTATDLAGDLDGDGRRDFVLGARDAGPFKNGRAYAYSSSMGRRLWTVTAPKSGNDFGSFFVAGLEDVDGDGTGDVYVGDYVDAANGGQAGAAYVLSGADGSFIHTWRGAHSKDGMGPGREVGDIDGDGVQDLGVGSYITSEIVKGGGRLDIFSGATGASIAAIRSTTLGENFGFDAVGLGDVNADGAPDFMVSAATGNTIYVISGALQS
jgi:FG-GAP repeat protein/VCBS repeat protein